MIALVGTVLISLMIYLNTPEPAILTMAGVLFGACVRDASVARKSARLWKIQRELIDWPKVEALNREFEL